MENIFGKGKGGEYGETWTFPVIVVSQVCVVSPFLVTQNCVYSPFLVSQICVSAPFPGTQICVVSPFIGTQIYIAHPELAITKPIYKAAVMHTALKIKEIVSVSDSF